MSPLSRARRHKRKPFARKSTSDLLHSSLVDVMVEALYRRATDLLLQKLKDKNIVLTDREEARLRRKLRAGNLSSMRIASLSAPASLEITADDIAGLEEYGDVILAKVTKAIPDAADEAAAVLVEALKRSWPREMHRQRREFLAFQKRHQRRWLRPLTGLGLLLTVSRDVGSQISAVTPENPEDPTPVLRDVLTRLHVRACQVAAEVMALLENGFADGAMARWRTLHEISVVSLFVADHGEPAAKRYVDHLVVANRKAAAEYIRSQKRAKLTSFEPKERVLIEQQYQGMLTKHGESFAEDYGWAVPYLKPPNPRPNFTHLERAVERDHLRPYYRLASYNVHAYPKGAFVKLGIPHGENVLLGGASNFGLSDPGQNTAISLALMSAALTKLNLTFDFLVLLNAVHALSKSVCAEFTTVHRQLAGDEKECPPAYREVAEKD